MKGEEPEKEAAPAASVKKQPPLQENPAAIQPVKAAAAEVSGAYTWHKSMCILNVFLFKIHKSLPALSSEYSSLIMDTYIYKCIHYFFF